jgi:hypothetical protein
MHGECGCKTQLSGAKELALAREATIWCYSTAVLLHTRETHPQDWARLQTNMATAWSDRVLGDRADNIERAIACYRDALHVRTREAVPHDWACLQMNMGNAQH